MKKREKKAQAKVFHFVLSVFMGSFPLKIQRKSIAVREMLEYEHSPFAFMFNMYRKMENEEK